MRLKKLEIYGFKSFAERTEIVFQQGTTGIVGPNGSGKSNISDAVRWVLGEQSAKSLRGAKMEDIIFNGTEKRKPLAWCEVALVFENEDHALPVDFAEVMVTRRVYRNGESEYYLNKATCRLRDIQELFRDTGIGKEGYSLIGQGRIDEILSVKSEDRRNVFEEAAGIVKYKARKEEAERRMENTRQNLVRVEDILEELEKQLGPLEEQSEAARRFLTLNEELKSLDLNAFLLRHDNMRGRMEELDATLAGLAGVMEEAGARIQRMQDASQAQEAQAQQWEGEVNEAHEQVLEATRALETREGMNNVLRERIAHAVSDEERMHASLQGSQARLSELDKACETYADQVRVYTDELSLFRERLIAEEAAFLTAQAHAVTSEEALERHKAELIAMMNRLSDVKSTQARLSTMRQTLEKRIEEAARDEEALLVEQQTYEENFRAAEESASAVGDVLKELSTETLKVEDMLRQAAQEAEALSARGQQVTAKQHETSSRLRVLREMERDYEGYQHSVKQVLLRARQEKGVLGVVATLLRVPAKLERAVEMVLGGALQNVVTEDEHVAKRMIDYLRAQRFGRATFLPLTTVFGRTLTRDERAVLDMPGCLGVASELVAFDTKYRGVAESLLGRTIIAENLDAGIEIMRRGRHAFRLVTIEGDVMHSGGSMSGGSVQSRMTSLLSREREIAEHEKMLTDLQAESAQIRTDMDALEKLRVDIKRDRNELYARTHQEEIAVAREQERMAKAEADLRAHARRLSDVRLQAEQMRDNLRDIEEQLRDSDATQDHAEGDQADRQRETHRLTEALAKAREQMETVREGVTRLKVGAAAQERELEAKRREYDRLCAERVELMRRKGEEESALARRLQTREADEAACRAGEAQHADEHAALARHRDRLARAEAQQKQAQAQLRETRQSIDSLRNDVAGDTERHHRMELQRAKVENDFKQLQERIWLDYELTYAGAQEYSVTPFDLSASEKRISVIRAEIREMGTVNVRAVEDYRLTRDRFDDLSAQRTDLLRATEDLQGIIEELLSKMEKRFRQQFKLLGEYFTETFTSLFGGGKAELKLTDESDVLGCGIEIVAQPPGKKLQLLTLLSGGERALTAIAILFAMLKLKPTPFCILDEIEAALDEANVANFADYLAAYSRNTQFVVVTHRKGTMERCEALYGVAMEERGVSRMVSVKLSQAVESHLA